MLQKDDLKAKTISGAKWAGFGQMLTNIGDFVVYAVLARILFPEDFGVFGLATVFIGLVTFLNQLGIEIAIIQKKDLRDSHLSTTFWIVMGMGVFLCGSIMSFSGFFADLYGSQALRPILEVFPLTLIFSDLGFVHYSLIQREIRFDKLAVIEIITVLSGGITSVVMAYAGLGIWSLIWSWMAQSLLRSVLSWLACDWRPKAIFDFQCFKELFKYGKHIVGSRISYQMTSNIIYSLIGRTLGEVALGLYTLAYKLAHIPDEKLSSIISRVVLPIFSSYQEDNTVTGWIFQKKMTFLSLISFPFLMGLTLTAPRFIEIVYGYKWTAAAVPLQILCFMGIARSLTTNTYTILRSKGRPDMELYWSLIAMVVLPLFLFLGLKFQLTGACVALTITTIILYLGGQYVVNNLIDLSSRELVKNFYPAVVTSVVMVIALWVYEGYLGRFFPLSSFWGLVFPIAFGGGIYILALRILFRDTFNEMLKLMFPTR